MNLLKSQAKMKGKKGKKEEQEEEEEEPAKPVAKAKVLGVDGLIELR